MRNIFSNPKILGLVLGGAFSAATIGYKLYPREPEEKLTNIPYSQIVADIRNKALSNIVIEEGPGRYFLVATDTKGRRVFSSVPSQENIAQRLLDAGLPFRGERPPAGKGPLGYVVEYGPLVGLVAAYYFISKQMGNARDKIMSDAKNNSRSQAKLLTKDENPVTFADVEGIDEAKQELCELVEFIKNPERFSRLGAKVSGGTLLVGPPGTGKTLLAKAVAGECGIPFYSVAGSNFDEFYMGTGLGRVKDMFEEARRNAPCVLFIDEIDALGKSRANGGQNHSDGEQEKTLNQFLVEMDGAGSNNKGVHILAATNRPEVLDKALLRPGRFNRQIAVQLPDVEGRQRILGVHSKGKPLAADAALEAIATRTSGFSGAELANLVNEAGMMAARRNGTDITMADFEAAFERILMGAERKIAMNPQEKKSVAYHEIGHALVTLRLPETDPLHKVTIVPRGRALGMSISLPDSARYNMTRAEMCGRIAELFGGRIAEQIAFGSENVGTGAQNDIERATAIAQRMVKQYGMSKEVGPVCHERITSAYLDAEAQALPVSEETARLIDAEIRQFIQNGWDQALAILAADKEEGTLDKAAEILLKKETITAQELVDLIGPDAKYPVAARQAAPGHKARENSMNLTFV